VELEQFTDVFLAKFKNKRSACFAKKFSDAKEFYGGILHISYAPELETLDELREKFVQRSKDVSKQINRQKNNSNTEKI